MSSRPSSRQWRRKASTSKGSDSPKASVIAEFSRSTVQAGSRGWRLARANRSSTAASSSGIGNMPFLKQLL